MKVVAAYLLAVLGGNTCPSADDLKDILGSVGAEADDDRIDLLLSEVKGKDITELIAAGREKLASVPSGGGGGGVAVAAAPSGGAAGGAAPAAEAKKEEKVEEKEESDDDMGFSGEDPRVLELGYLSTRDSDLAWMREPEALGSVGSRVYRPSSLKLWPVGSRPLRSLA
ncbi:hypothetical protein NL676_019073 [Syzygium grande]|nr:hypothetical protein NL676_019073 [Syzygium grande]